MSEFSLDNVNSMYMDVLKEIGNIGAGNATTAIAGMLGTTMKMEVPRISSGVSMKGIELEEQVRIIYKVVNAR